MAGIQPVSKTNINEIAFFTIIDTHSGIVEKKSKNESGKKSPRATPELLIERFARSKELQRHKDATPRSIT